MESECFRELTPLFQRVEDTKAMGYSETFRTLNVERLHFNPLRGLTVVERNAVLNGILQASTPNALR